MKNKKMFIILCVAVIAVILLITKPGFKTVDGKKFFNISELNDGYSVYVIRVNQEILEFDDEKVNVEHKEYLLDENQKNILINFIENAKYREHKNFNLYWLHPDIKSVTSVSTHDKFEYRIIFRMPNGNEILHILTCGDDYITCSTKDEWIKIVEKNWGSKIDEIIMDAQLMETYFE